LSDRLLEDDKQVIGYNQHDLFYHHYPNGYPYPQCDCPIHKTTQDGQTRRTEEWFIRASGDGFPVNLVVTPLHQEDRLVGSVVVFQDITELKKLQQKLVEQSHVDALTGLANRRYLLKLMHQEFERIKRNHHSAVLIMADLDHFKNVNDTYGHAAGDQVLKAFAKLMNDTLRKTDIIGRLGGEEFVILLPETALDQALEMAERLKHNAQMFSLNIDQHIIQFTVSLGMVEIHPDHNDIETSLAKADNALYQAKSNGRNRIEVYHDPSH
jgi:diguanylate cyclase (GGDEF)-like protein